MLGERILSHAEPFWLHFSTPLFSALFAIEIQMAAINGHHTWREHNPVGSQSFIKLPISCVSATFVFLFYTCSPRKSVGPLGSARRHLNRCFEPLQAPLLVEAFLLDSISFENKQKARYTYS